MKYMYMCYLIFCGVYITEAQIVIRGHVYDAGTIQKSYLLPIYGASVTTAGKQNLNDFRTDQKGYYQITLSSSVTGGSIFRLLINKKGYETFDQIEVAGVMPIDVMLFPLDHLKSKYSRSNPIAHKPLKLVVNTTITPNADVVVEKKEFKWGFGCDDIHQKRLESYEIPIGYVLDADYDNPEWRVFGGQGPAGIDVRRTKGERTVECGCWAASKGWGPENRLNGEMVAHAKKYGNMDLKSFTKSAQGYYRNNNVYQFDYDMSTIPKDILSLKWEYDIEIKIIRGNTSFSIPLSNVKPLVTNQFGIESITSKIEDGKLVVAFTR